MDAASIFPDMLQTVVDLIVEKELRLRTPLEELQLLMDNVITEDMEGDSVNDVADQEMKDTDVKDLE